MAPKWRIIVGSALAAAVASTVLLNVGSADAATNYCHGGRKFAASALRVDGKKIGELVVYKFSGNRYCGFTRHVGRTVGVRLETSLGLYTPNGKGCLDCGNYRYYAGPYTVDGCPSCAPWYGFEGGIKYRGHDTWTHVPIG